MGLTRCQGKSHLWVQQRHALSVQISHVSAGQGVIRISLLYFGGLAYRLGTVMTHMLWLKRIILFTFCFYM